MKTVETDKVVTLNYTLTSDRGEVLDSSNEDGPLVYLHGADNIVPGLEKAIEGKKVGDKFSVVVEPDEGYGERDDEGVFRVGRSQFPANMDLQVGMSFHAQHPEDDEPAMAWIVGVEGDQVAIDFNHPLAGERLNFAVEVLDIRDATAEELEHGHPHGPDGHHHH